MNGDPCTPGDPGGYPSDCEVTAALRERAERRQAPVSRRPAWQEALPRARRVELLLMDVDGVLTDGALVYTVDGGENKRFHTQDGFGLRLLREAGIATGLITARESAVVTRRARELAITHLHQGRADKAAVLLEIMAKSGLEAGRIAYMGDDWLDLPVLSRVGLSLAPANAVAEVRQRVDYVTRRNGGSGAVREACDLILEARGFLPDLLKKFGGQ